MIGELQADLGVARGERGGSRVDLSVPYGFEPPGYRMSGFILPILTRPNSKYAIIFDLLLVSLD